MVVQLEEELGIMIMIIVYIKCLSWNGESKFSDIYFFQTQDQEFFSYFVSGESNDNHNEHLMIYGDTCPRKQI